MNVIIISSSLFMYPILLAQKIIYYNVIMLSNG